MGYTVWAPSTAESAISQVPGQSLVHMEHMPDVEQVVLLLFIPPVNGELKFGEYDILKPPQDYIWYDIFLQITVPYIG